MKDIINLTNLTTAFSVRFCDNLLLVLKMRFQVFSFASKTLHSFSSARKILRETRNSFKKWPLNSWRISSETIVEVKNVTKDCYFCDCNWTRTQNHLVLKRTLNHLAKLVLAKIISNLKIDGLFFLLRILILFWIKMLPLMSLYIISWEAALIIQNQCSDFLFSLFIGFRRVPNHIPINKRYNLFALFFICSEKSIKCYWVFSFWFYLRKMSETTIENLENPGIWSKHSGGLPVTAKDRS